MLFQIEEHHQLSSVEETSQEEAEEREEQQNQEEPASQPELAPEESQVPVEEKKEFKLRAEEDPPILPPPKVGEAALDENANDPLQQDFEASPKLSKLLKNKNLLNGRLSRSGEEILAEIKTDPNKVGWRTKPRDWDWKHRSTLGSGKGIEKLFTCFKYSGWRFLCH